MNDVVLELPFLGGIDQTAREEIVDPARSFTSLTNIRQDKRGGASKRLGYRAVGRLRLDDSTRTSGLRLLMKGEQICTIDQSCVIDAYSAAADRFVPRGLVPEADYSFIEAPSFGAFSYVTDVAHVNGYLVVAYRVDAGTGTTSYAYAAVLDAETYTIVRGPERIDTSTKIGHIGLAPFGDTKCGLAFYDGTVDEVRLQYIDTNALAVGWLSIENIAFANGGHMSIATLPTAPDRFAVAYSTTVGASRITVRTYNESGIVDTTAINTSSKTPSFDSLDMSEHGQTLWVCWAENTTCKVVGLDPLNLGAPLATAATVFTTAGNPGVLRVGSRDDTTGALIATIDSRQVVVRNFKTAAGAVATDGASVTVCNARCLGRPFLQGGRLYAAFGSGSVTAKEYVICEWTPTTKPVAPTTYLRPVVVPVVRGLLADVSLSAAAHCRVAPIESGRTYATGFTVEKTGTTLGATLIKLDFASRDRWKPAEHHGSVCLSGGVTTIFDGARAFESGYLCAPPQPSVSATAPGPLTLTSGRRYCAAYGFVDNDGNLHISGISDPSASTGPLAGKQVEIGVDPLSITSKADSDVYASNLQILLFATNDGGEEPYHLIASARNDPNAGVVFFNDQIDENTVRAGALLYGSGNLPGTVVDGQPGGPQDHRAPPGLKFLTSYNGMLVGASGSEFWWTSEAVYGEGVWWSPIFSAPLGETITGFAVLDGSLLIFTRTAIYAVSGSPPNDTGTDPGLGIPRRLSVDLGCINGDSIVSTSLGVFFQSAHGLELLTRGQSIVNVGTDIQDELEAFPLITSAVLDTKHGLVRFTLAHEGRGRDVVYDLALGAWISSDRKYGTVPDQPSQDAAMLYYQGAWRYGWLATNGYVYVEQLATDDDAHRDVGQWVKMRAETSWIHIAGLGGEQVIERILHLSSKHADHAVVRTVYRDYLATDPQVTTWTWDQIAALSKQWLDKELETSRGQAIRVVLEDAEPTDDNPETPYDIGNGKGATWVCLTFVGTPHRGPRRTSAAERG